MQSLQQERPVSDKGKLGKNDDTAVLRGKIIVILDLTLAIEKLVNKII